VRHARQIKPAGEWNLADAVDCITLDAHERHRRRIVFTAEGGTTFMLDLARAATLRDGDGLVLDDGAIIRVAGKPEPLVEISAASPEQMARIAWHIGNRHVEMQVIGDRLRVRRDRVIEDMLQRLGAFLRPINAPFNPEPGAYESPHAYGDE
jgi:urease accessory protein